MLGNIIGAFIGVALATAATLIAEPSFSWRTWKENPWPWVGIFVSALAMVAVSIVGEKLAMPIVTGAGGATFMTFFVYVGRVLHDRRVKGFTYPLYWDWVMVGRTVDERRTRLSILQQIEVIDKATFDGWSHLLFQV